MNAEQFVPRCEAVNEKNQQCGFPAGHTGQHGNGSAVIPWSDVVDSTPNLYEAEEPALTKRERIMEIMQDVHGTTIEERVDAIIAALEDKSK